jgi:hypothetical protein
MRWSCDLGASTQVLEPFIECPGLHSARQPDGSYLFGYRAVETQNVIASVEIPIRLVEDVILRGSKLSVRLTSDGQVVSELSFRNHAASSIEKWSGPLPLDQLICVALAPNNLRMEESTTEELTTLVQRLEDSAKLARAALARCEGAKQHGTER